MIRWKKIYYSFKKAIGVFFLLLLALWLFRYSSEITYYKEYIRGEEKILADRQIEKGAQSLAEIEKIEQPILAEIKERKGDIAFNQELEQAKEKLRLAEEEHKGRKKIYDEKQIEFEKMIPIETTFLVEKDEVKNQIAEERGRANSYEILANIRREEELKKVRELVIDNIQQELKRAKLAINDLDIAYEDNREWKKRSLIDSLKFDPQRFFLIHPLQAISRKLEINTSTYAFWDILLKVFAMRLILNWISYPPTNQQVLVNSESEDGEFKDIHDLEKEKEIALQRTQGFKQMLFNIAMMILLVTCFSFHDFAFNRESALYNKIINFAYVIPFVLVSLISNFLVISYQKPTSLQAYLQNNWASSLIAPFILFIIIYNWSNSHLLGRFLPSLLSEGVNIVIYLILLLFRYHKSNSQSKKQS